MRFDRLTVFALLASDATEFTIPAFNAPGGIPNQGQRNGGYGYAKSTSSLLMADERLSEKEKRLRSIQENLDATDARRLSLKAELEAAEKTRTQLELEAAEAAKLPDPLKFNVETLTSGPVPIVGGGVVALAAARAALSGRDEVKSEAKQTQMKTPVPPKRENNAAAQKAAAQRAAEQDARNRAAAAAKKAKAKKTTTYAVKAAAEQDARNRAAAAAKGEEGSNVSLFLLHSNTFTEKRFIQ